LIKKQKDPAKPPFGLSVLTQPMDFQSIVFQFPPANAILKKKFGFSIPILLKIILHIVIIMFTLGVIDLGDVID